MATVRQLLVRTSERTSYKRCRWAWDRDFNDRLKPIQEAPALRFGTLIHAALEERYPPGLRRGPKPAGTFAKLFDAEMQSAIDAWGFRDEDGTWMEAREVGVDMMEHYVEHYGRDEEWKVLASEQTFQVPVYDRCDACGAHWSLPVGRAVKVTPSKRCACGEGRHKYVFTYVGTMDGVWENRMDGSVRINDYKTTKNDPTKEARSKILDEQTSAYWTWGVDYLIWKKMLKPRHIEALNGMLFTFLRKAIRDDRPTNADGLHLNQDGTVSKKQPSPYFHRELVYRSAEERDKARDRAIAEVREMKLIRAGKLSAYKAPDSIKCNMCSFRDLCELHEMGSDWEGLRDATMTTWEPYAAHEIREENKR